MARVYIVSLINSRAAYNPTVASRPRHPFAPPSVAAAPFAGNAGVSLSPFPRDRRLSRAAWKLGWAKKYSRTILLFTALVTSPRRVFRAAGTLLVPPLVSRSWYPREIHYLNAGTNVRND